MTFVPHFTHVDCTVGQENENSPRHYVGRVTNTLLLYFVRSADCRMVSFLFVLYDNSECVVLDK